MPLALGKPRAISRKTTDMGDVKTLPDFKLTFQDYDSDIARYKDELRVRGKVVVFAAEEVYHAYVRNGSWVGLARANAFDSYSRDGAMEITRGLMGTREYSMVKRFWRPYLADRKVAYWEHFSLVEKQKLPYDEQIAPLRYKEWNARWQNETWPRVRDEAIGAFRAYRDLVIRMNDPAELARVEDELRAVETGQRRKPKNKKPDATKMDEVLFWEIIEAARKPSDGSSEATVEAITNRLEDFKAAEIKRFQTILLDKLDALNTWDVWALIYLAQGGCSDDSFLNFRWWVILQGQALFNNCIANVETAMHAIPSDGSASNESLHSAADIAHDIRSGGKSMTLAKRKEKGPSGKEWDEKNVEAAYPRIAAYYQTHKNR